MVGPVQRPGHHKYIYRRQRRDQLNVIRRLLFKVADVLFGSVMFACGALKRTQMCI
jgi:hypothetical protein